MPDLSQKLTEARDRAIARLSDLHDDYFHTNLLWIKLLSEQQLGESFTANNLKTGMVTADQPQWLGRARSSQQRLRIRTFKDLTTQFELFLADALRLWLAQYPDLVQRRSITLGMLLSMSDLETAKKMAIDEAVHGEVSKILFDKPARWFTYLKSHLGSKISGADVATFVESKAARDVLEHHNGIVDQSYLDKAASAARYTFGDPIDPDDTSIDVLYDLITRLITELADDAQRWSVRLTKN